MGRLALECRSRAQELRPEPSRSRLRRRAPGALLPSTAFAPVNRPFAEIRRDLSSSFARAAVHGADARARCRSRATCLRSELEQRLDLGSARTASRYFGGTAALAIANAQPLSDGCVGGRARACNRTDGLQISSPQRRRYLHTRSNQRSLLFFNTKLCLTSFGLGHDTEHYLS